MEIILENILNLEILYSKRKLGCSRNYLLKNGKALRFNQKNLDYVAKKKDELNKKY